MPLLYEEKYQSRVLVWYRDFIDFLPHFHENIEIAVMLDGSCTANVDFKDYPLQKGDVFISFPNQIHSYTNENAVRCYLLIFPYTLCPQLSELFDGKLPVCPVIRDEARFPEVVRVTENIYHHLHGKNTYCNRAITNGYFSVLLGTLLECLTLTSIPESSLSAERRIIRYCNEHFREKLTLPLLEKELYISRYHISHLFSSRLKIGFNDFINQLRVDEACRLLKSGCSVAEAAFGSGFSSIRTFNRAFLKDIGSTPRDYQKDPSVSDR